jgi:glycosyltransferase involved in cell wall biosynthesis
VAVASSGGYLADILRKEGIPTHEIEALRGRTPAAAEACLQLSRVMRSGDYEVVNSHSFITAFMCFWATRIARTGTRHIFTVHIPENPKYYAVMGVSLNFLCEEVITVCEDGRQQLIRHGLRSRAITVVHNGIDQRSFRFTPRTSPGKTVTIGIIARLIERKGHRILFEAVRSLRPRYKLHIHVIGDGPERTRLESLARHLALDEQISFLGECHDVPERLSKLDVFVLPSFYEGFPVTIIEALSVGVPVIASAVNGIPEVIRDGETGVLVRPNDSIDLAGAIERVINDESLRARIVAKGRRLVTESFSVQHMINGYELLLRNAG